MIRTFNSLCYRRLQVDITRSPRRLRTTANCAKGTAGVDLDAYDDAPSEELAFVRETLGTNSMSPAGSRWSSTVSDNLLYPHLARYFVMERSGEASPGKRTFRNLATAAKQRARRRNSV
jgi:hypothetical protein